MSETDTTRSAMSVTGVEPVTEEVPVTGSPRHVATSGSPGEFDGTLGSDDEEWPVRGPRKGIRMPVPTMLLLAVLIAAGGLWGGAALQRSHGSTSTSSAASPFAALRGGGASGISGLGGAGALGGCYHRHRDLGQWFHPLRHELERQSREGDGRAVGDGQPERQVQSRVSSGGRHRCGAGFESHEWIRYRHLGVGYGGRCFFGLSWLRLRCRHGGMTGRSSPGRGGVAGRPSIFVPAAESGNALTTGEQRQGWTESETT